MANPFFNLITATGTYTYFPDFMQSPFNLSQQIGLASGVTASYSVSFTLDDINATTGAALTNNTPTSNAPGDVNYIWVTIWLPDPSLGTSQTASGYSYYQFPIRGLRLVVASLSGGNMQWDVIQGLSSR